MSDDAYQDMLQELSDEIESDRQLEGEYTAKQLYDGLPDDAKEDISFSGFNQRLQRKTENGELTKRKARADGRTCYFYKKAAPGMEEDTPEAAVQG